MFVGEEEEWFRALSRGWRWGKEVINLLSCSTPVLESSNSFLETGPDQSKDGNKTPVYQSRGLSFVAKAVIWARHQISVVLVGSECFKVVTALWVSVLADAMVGCVGVCW